MTRLSPRAAFRAIGAATGAARTAPDMDLKADF